MHLRHILFKFKLFPLRNFIPVRFLFSPGVGEPGNGDGGNDPVGEETYFFFPLKRRINLFALSIVAIKYLFCFYFTNLVDTKIYINNNPFSNFSQNTNTAWEIN